MEFKKISEQYSVKDVIEENGWAVSGGATLEIDGHLTIYWEVLEEDVKIGSFNYAKPAKGNATISYSIAEENRIIFMNHSMDLLEEILKNFKSEEDEVEK